MSHHHLFFWFLLVLATTNWPPLLNSLPVPLKVSCPQVEVSPGHFQAKCDFEHPAHGVFERESILWLKVNGSSSQRVDIALPRYVLNQKIVGAVKSGENEVQSKINIQLPAPIVNVDASEQGGTVVIKSAPEVQFEYEASPGEERIHYPVDKPYKALEGKIAEPASRPAAGGQQQFQNYQEEFVNFYEQNPLTIDQGQPALQEHREGEAIYYPAEDYLHSESIYLNKDSALEKEQQRDQAQWLERDKGQPDEDSHSQISLAQRNEVTNSQNDHNLYRDETNAVPAEQPALPLPETPENLEADKIENLYYPTEIRDPLLLKGTGNSTESVVISIPSYAIKHMLAAVANAKSIAEVLAVEEHRAPITYPLEPVAVAAPLTPSPESLPAAAAPRQPNVQIVSKGGEVLFESAKHLPGGVFEYEPIPLKAQSNGQQLNSNNNYDGELDHQVFVYYDPVPSYGPGPTPRITYPDRPAQAQTGEQEAEQALPAPEDGDRASSGAYLPHENDTYHKIIEYTDESFPTEQVFLPQEQPSTVRPPPMPNHSRFSLGNGQTLQLLEKNDGGGGESPVELTREQHQLITGNLDTFLQQLREYGGDDVEIEYLNTGSDSGSGSGSAARQRQQETDNLFINY